MENFHELLYKYYTRTGYPKTLGLHLLNLVVENSRHVNVWGGKTQALLTFSSFL